MKRVKKKVKKRVLEDKGELKIKKDTLGDIEDTDSQIESVASDTIDQVADAFNETLNEVQNLVEDLAESSATEAESSVSEDDDE